MGENTKKPAYPISALFLLFLLFLFVPALLLISQTSSYGLPVFKGTVNAPGAQWYFGEKGGQMHPVDLSQKQPMEPHKTYVLSTTIRYDGESDAYPSAIFLVSNYGVKVYYQDTLVFQRIPEDVPLPTVGSLGPLAFSVPLGYDCAGQELRLELYPMMNNSHNASLPDIQFGDYATTMRHIYFSSLPGLVIVAAILFLCVALLLIGSVHQEMRTKCLNLALFATAFSVYQLTESQFVQHMAKTPYLLYLGNHLVLALLPIFLTHAYRSRFSLPFQKYIRLVEAICWLNFGGQALLHFSGILDLRYMFLVTQCCCFLVCLSMIIPMIVERNRPVMRRVALEVAPLFVGSFLDFISYFMQFNSGKAWYYIGRYVSIGFLMTLIIVIYEVRKASEQAAAESLKSQFFQEMAYTDSLTGVGNRAAFDEELNKLSSEGSCPQSMLCISADLNNLKVMNDTHGHHEGDALIQRCAALLDDCFSSQGRVFRVGGDEFNVFLYDVTEADWPTLKKQFEKKIEKCNREEAFPLSVALGCAAVSDGNVAQALQLADERMYEAKSSASCKRDSKHSV